MIVKAEMDYLCIVQYSIKNITICSKMVSVDGLITDVYLALYRVQIRDGGIICEWVLHENK